jgi:hypothetical protein
MDIHTQNNRIRITESSTLLKAFMLFLCLCTHGIFSFAYLRAETYSPSVHQLPVDIRNFDAAQSKVKPGDTIVIEPGLRQSIRITGIRGNSSYYVIVCNGDGEVIVRNDDFHYGVVFADCSFFRFTGSANNTQDYGVKILGTGPGANGLSVDRNSTDFEIDHIEIANTGFAGIMIGTQPTCDLMSNRGNFVLRNAVIRQNYIHDTGGEGMYIGHSFYNGYAVNCNEQPTVLYPHEIHGLRVFENLLEHTGYDAIQVGCASEDAEVFSNIIRNYGKAGKAMQHSGIQIGAGTKIRCYSNQILAGTGTGIMMLGFANSYIYNNLIMNPGENYFPDDPGQRIYGIFVDDRSTIPGTSYYILHNTIIGSKSEGIRFMSKLSKHNLIANNLIISPGARYAFKPGSYRFIYLFPDTDVDLTHNVVSDYLMPGLSADSIGILMDLLQLYPLQKKGIDVSEFRILRDLVGRERSSKPTVGCFEFDGLASEPIVESNAFRVTFNSLRGEIGIENLTEGNIHTVTLTDLNGRLILKQSIDEPSYFRTVPRKFEPGEIFLLTIGKAQMRQTHKIAVTK